MKLILQIVLILIFTFKFSIPVYSTEKDLSPKNSFRSNSILELKHKILKAHVNMKSSAVHKIENIEMSKTSSTLLGGGIGLIAGGLLGGVLAGNSNDNDDNPVDEGLSIGGGIVLGGLSGLILGGLTGYLLGK